MRNIVRLSAVFILISLQIFPLHLTAFACAIPLQYTADGKLKNSFQVNVERAVIIWDEKTQTEHFIRSAEFSGEGKDLGFLVPTPSAPQLSETSNEFSFLMDITKAEHIKKRVFDGFDFMPLSFLLLPLGNDSVATTSTSMDRATPHPSAAAMEPIVRVLDKKTVAGYDAVVLEADTTAVLEAWLKKNNYASSPELIEWLGKYIQAHWKITAFKVTNNLDARTATLGAVRMSFKTDKPFYPYREPKTETPAERRARALWVWLVGKQRMSATIGDGSATKWQAEMDWSNMLTAEQRQQIATNYKLPVEQIPVRLTEFIDQASPRPATDELYFAATADQSVVIPPPIIDEDKWQFPLPLDLVLLLLFIATTIFFWRKRNSNKLRATR